MLDVLFYILVLLGVGSAGLVWIEKFNFADAVLSSAYMMRGSLPTQQLSTKSGKILTAVFSILSLVLIIWLSKRIVL